MTEEEIRIRMIQKGLRQKDLALRWDRPRSIVSRLVKGKIKTRSLRVKLARALGVTLRELDNGISGDAAKLRRAS